jgi:hypothetical protein
MTGHAESQPENGVAVPFYQEAKSPLVARTGPFGGLLVGPLHLTGV